MERVSTLTLVILAIALSIIAAFFWTLSKHNQAAAIDTYDKCVAAGNPILESYPSQCRTPDGRTFVNPNEHVQMPTPVENSATTTSPQAGGGCVVGGCSGELCIDASEGPAVSNCIYSPAFACYKTARCERQTSGACDWTPTPGLAECLADNTSSQNASDTPQ